MADPEWRRLLAEAGSLPPAARAASPALADEVVRAAAVERGTPVLAVRAYMAPLGAAVAERVGAPWCALDLDDDDEALARAEGEDEDAEAYRRLVATFGPRFGAVSLAAPADAAVVGRRHGVRAVTVPNAVTIPPGPVAPRAGGGRVLFVANLAYAPNVEAATVLVERVLPALEARLARPVEVDLVGAHDPEGPVAALGATPHVRATGYVTDVEPYYQRAAVVVAPIRRGSGTRIKVLEAFAHRVPVVTTPVGAAGLAVRHKTHLLVGETPDEMAALAADVMGAAPRADSLAQAAFEFVRRHHDREAMAEAVATFLELARQPRRVS
jgi:hypothetical protein